jgi:hypothetical protein
VVFSSNQIYGAPVISLADDVLFWAASWFSWFAFAISLAVDLLCSLWALQSFRLWGVFIASVSD